MSELDAKALLRVRWKAAEETTIGGWCIQPEDELPTHAGGVSLADFVMREHAEYIAQLHNHELDAIAANRAAEWRA